MLLWWKILDVFRLSIPICHPTVRGFLLNFAHLDFSSSHLFVYTWIVHQLMVFYFDFRKITSMVRRGMQELWTRTTDVRQKLSPHTETQSESLFHHFLNRHGTSHLKLYKFLIPTSWRLSSLGHNTNGSRMCGILLYVEEVGALWPLCAAESIWKEKIQQLSWRNVSSRGWLAASACVFFFFLLSFEKCGENVSISKCPLQLNISLCLVTWWTG